MNLGSHYGNTGCGVFKRGTELERFLPKNQHTQRKLLNFENWVNGGGFKKCKITQPLDFQSQFSISKIVRIFLNFFFIEEYQFWGTFFVIDIF